MKVFESLKKSFHANAPSGMFCSLRFVQNDSEELAVRQNVFHPIESGQTQGFMVTVRKWC
jgi:predicted Zn-dependent protease